ncbi:hypothetical protein GCM10027039_37760 [Terrabacter koreensis]
MFAVVVAHPDDEVFSWAGTVALHAHDPDFRFVLIHATRGEAGDIRPGFPATRDTLGSIRQAESEAAWRAVGRTPDRHEWLGYPDSGLAGVPAEELSERIGEILAEERPDVVAGFGRDGITGHPDHVTVGACTDAAFAGLVRSGGPGFRRLLHHVLPQSVFDRWQQQRRELDLPVFDPTRSSTVAACPTTRSISSSTAGRSHVRSSRESSSTGASCTSWQTSRSTSTASRAS